MLKNIPVSFTPELVRLMMEMGHGEELLLADANFPALTIARGTPRIFTLAPGIAGLLEDILRFFPLDDTVKHPAVVMEAARENDVYAQYDVVLQRAGVPDGIETLERFAFYERARAAAGIVITADTVRAGNILLKKGVV